MFPVVASDLQALVAARACIEQARDDLQTAAARIPRPDELAWRSASANRFAARIDDLRDHLVSAMSTLDAAASAFEASVASQRAAASLSSTPPMGERGTR